jgi:hypothetical protein
MLRFWYFVCVLLLNIVVLLAQLEPNEKESRFVMASIRWEGTVTAASSIVHGAQVLGTVTYLRRERFLLPNGSVEEIPVVSGNAVRGLLRDTAADLWWNSVGQPQLTLPMMHALWSGGSLAKSSGDPLTGSRLAAVRAACPVVGVFGTAGGGRVVDGTLQVGKLIPICQETAHIVPAEFRGEVLPSLWDLTQIEWYSRLPNLPHETMEIALEGSSKDSETSQLARFGVETFIAGTRFYTWMNLAWATPVEVAFFQEVLHEFSNRARVGGMGRAGHGELALDLHPTQPLVEQPFEWRTHAQQLSREELLQLLARLD